MKRQVVDNDARPPVHMDRRSKLYSSRSEWIMIFGPAIIVLLGSAVFIYLWWGHHLQ